MERKKLKLILLNFYSVAMANMILRGERKPAYKIICDLDTEHNIPFTAWLDIKSYVNDNKRGKSVSSGRDIKNTQE